MYKILFSLLILFFYIPSDAQSLNYYNRDNNGFKVITVLVPPKNGQATEIYYNSSSNTSVQKIKEIKDISTKEADASVITIGDDKTEYLLVSAKDGKHMVMADTKGLFYTIYELDSSIFNPLLPPDKQADFNPMAKSLVSIFKLLL